MGALGSRRLGHIGGPLEHCYVEVKDLGFAKPSVEPFEPVLLPTVPEQHTQSETQHVNLLQTLVDDVDSEAHDTTMEPLAQCPSTVLYADFPHDGCYIVEEMHPMLMCEGSKNTKVHVHYSKVLQANGTVDQAANGGQWAFLGALQFYAGHPGKVTLSNEGTEPGTLTVFDQVRFTWSGKDCIEVDAHPRRVEIRINADFQHVAQRTYDFGRALTTKLAALAHVPENSLRLIGLRSGSIIAEFLVLPNVAQDVLIPNHSAQRNVGYLRDAVAKNAAELCALALGSRRLEHIGGPLKNCYVEIEDLGFALPSVEPFEPVPVHTVPEQRTQTEMQDTTGTSTTVIIVIFSVAAAMLLLFALHTARSRRTKSLNSSVEATQAYEIKVASSMEAGEPVKDLNSVEQDDDNSTICPSPSNDDRQSDIQSEHSQKSSQSLCVAACNGRGASKEQVVAWM